MRKNEFCETVRTEREKIFRGDPGIAVRDMLTSVVGSAVFAAAMALLVGLLATIVYNLSGNAYFQASYLAAVGITLVSSFLLYWTNYKYRRFRSILLTSIWQSLLFMISIIGVFALTQFLLIAFE